MAKKKKKSWLNRFLQRFGGVALSVAALMVIVASIFYQPEDNAMNVANGQPVRNLLGLVGAISADFSVSFFGIVLSLFLLVFIAWGVSLARLRPVINPYSRVFAWIVGLVCGCAFFAAFPPAAGWLELGGVCGGFVLSHIMTFVNTLYPLAYADIMVAVLLFVLMMMGFDYAMGITCKDWWRWTKFVSVKTYHIIAIWCLYLYKVVARICFIFGKLFRRRAAEVDDGEGEVVLTRAPKKEKVRKEPKLSDESTSSDEKSSEDKEKRSTAKPKTTSKNDGYVFPDVALLTRPAAKGGTNLSEKELDAIARELEGVLEEFGVHGNIVKVRPGPVVTLYELEPAPGTKTARVIGLADDIARSMSAVSVRIAVVPGSNTIGIELPNKNRETVWLRDLIEDEQFKKSKNELNVVLGKDIGGRNVYADLAKMPHLLVAGTTGSGKSVGVNAMILSLLFRMTPDECKLIMIDPKMLEFSMYNGIPHLLTPVITDPAKAVIGLKWAVREMEERYRAMAQLNVRNIMGYNQKLKELKASGEIIKRTVQTGFDSETGKPIYEEQELDLTPLPYIVIVVDEMADLMLVAGKEVEAAIQRLAQMARAAGLHLIMSTQRPSVDVITGTIKANFPTRISYQVTSKIDSRTILGEQGAEQLLGRGDMLYMPAGQRPQRVHGGFAPDAEIEKVVEFIKAQKAPEYVEGVTEGELNTDKGGSSSAVFDKSDMGGGGSDEDLYRQAVEIVRNDKKVSTSYVQRRLRIGYNRAATIIDRMEEEGIISAPDHTGRRQVL